MSMISNQWVSLFQQLVTSFVLLVNSFPTEQCFFSFFLWLFLIIISVLLQYLVMGQLKKYLLMDENDDNSFPKLTNCIKYHINKIILFSYSYHMIYSLNIY